MIFAGGDKESHELRRMLPDLARNVISDQFLEADLGHIFDVVKERGTHISGDIFEDLNCIRLDLKCTGINTDLLGSFDATHFDLHGLNFVIRILFILALRSISVLIKVISITNLNINISLSVLNQ